MKNYLKFVTLFIGASILLWNCQKEEVSNITQQEMNSIIVKTVSLEDAKNIFQTFQKNQPKAKGNENLVVTPDWNTLSQKSLFYTDAMLTKVDVEINREGDFTTELLFINVNGEMKSVIYTLYIDSTTPDGKLQNARVYLTELNGEYIDGYRFLNGLIKTRILPKKENDVITSKNSAAKVADYPTSFWGGTSASTETGGDGETEGGGGCIDCVQLDEVVIVGYLNPTDPYAALDGYFNPVNEFTDIDNGIESGSGSGTTTGITVSTTEDVTTAIVIEPIVKCEVGEILIKGICVIDTETPCNQEGYVRDENGICGPVKTDQIIIDSTFENYPCQEMVVTDAYGVCSPLTQLVLDVFESSDNTNLVFSVSSTMSGNGNTFPVAMYNFKTKTCDVKVNIRESYLTTATDLSIARTIIHESVHALLVQMYEEGKFLLPDGTTDPNFANLADAYTKALETNDASGLGLPQHEYMSNLVEDIATSLSAYGNQNGYNLPFSYYEKLSWAGDLLQFYQQYLPDGSINPDWVTINNTIVAEQNNDNTLYDGNGNQILPKGKVANSATPCN